MRLTSLALFRDPRRVSYGIPAYFLADQRLRRPFRWGRFLEVRPERSLAEYAWRRGYACRWGRLIEERLSRPRPVALVRGMPDSTWSPGRTRRRSHSSLGNVTCRLGLRMGIARSFVQNDKRQDTMSFTCCQRVKTADCRHSASPSASHGRQATTVSRRKAPCKPCLSACTLHFVAPDP